MIKTKSTPDSLKASFPFWDGNGSETLAAALLSDDTSLDELVKADNFCRVPAVAPATKLQVKQIVTGEIIIINYGILNYYISFSLCTDVCPPSEKIRRRDVCESLSLIVFRYTFV